MLIPASTETSGHGTTGNARFYKDRLAEFLQSVPHRTDTARRARAASNRRSGGAFPERGPAGRALFDFEMRYFPGLPLPRFLPFPRPPSLGAGRGPRRNILPFWAIAPVATPGPNDRPLAAACPSTRPFGTIYSTNITPDRDTGIGNWSEDDFYRALHDGIAPGGKHLYPAFPYIYFRHISRQDSDDLFAYLHTLKPVHRPPTPNRLMFPFNLRFGMIFWNWLYFDKTPPTIPASAAMTGSAGEYLVNGLGHCAACHTPKTILFGDETDKAADRRLGGQLVRQQSGNGGQADGLGKWSRGRCGAIPRHRPQPLRHRCRLDAGKSHRLHQPYDGCRTAPPSPSI